MAQPLLNRDGTPMQLPGLASSTIPVSQNQTVKTSPTTNTSTTAGQEATSSAVNQVNSSVNTTPGALQALENLINQLTSRPDINPAQLEAKYPKAQRVFSPQFGWYYVNPKTGFSMSAAEAKQYDAQQEAAKAQEIRSAPVIEGGSEAQKQQKAERQTEIQRNRQQQANYSKEAAGTDAQALMQKAISDALEAAMPQITAGLEGAGTSRSTMAAGLTQKAALKGATEGAALAANLGAQYGQINTQLSGVLEALTRSDPNSPEALLLQAIVGSKGLVSVGTQSQQGVTVGQKTAGTVQQEGAKEAVTQINRTPTLPGAAPAPWTNYGLQNQNLVTDYDLLANRNVSPFMSVTNTTPTTSGSSVVTNSDAGLFQPGTVNQSMYAIEDEY